MKMGLIHNYFGIFSMHSEKYYFCMERSMQGDIESTQSKIETSIKMNIPDGGDCREFGQIGAGPH